MGLTDVSRLSIPGEKVKEAVMFYSVAEVKKEMNSVRYKKLGIIKHLDCRDAEIYERQEFRGQLARVPGAHKHAQHKDHHAGLVWRKKDLSSLPSGARGRTGGVSQPPAGLPGL